MPAQLDVRGRSRGKYQLLQNRESHITKPSNNLPARLAGGVGNVSIGDAGIFQAREGLTRALYRFVSGIERPVKVQEQALHVHHSEDEKGTGMKNPAP